MYLVVAYRWGWTNDHQYFVYAGVDKATAIKKAEDEAEDRGGKYGCAVYDFSDSGDDYRLDTYFPSSYGEPEPEWNGRIYMFERLGHVLYNFSEGHVYLPDPAREGILKPVKMEPPEWVVAEVKRVEEFAEALGKMKGKNNNLTP